MDDDTFDPGTWQNHLYRESERKHRYVGQTGSAFTDWQEAFRDDLRTVLGHHVIRDNRADDGSVQQLNTVVKEEYERQEWVVRTERRVHVPFYLLLPTGTKPPFPVVLTVHGHNETGKELSVGVYHDDKQRKEITEQRRDMAVQAVRRGYASIAPDMRAFGTLADSESEQEGQRACTNMQKNAQLYGRSLAGERVWDVLRLVDVVEDWPTLDADRIGITGHSGGAAVALFAAALDDRISPVAPNSYLCTFRDSIIAIDHCECNYVPGVLRLGEMWDVAGLIAPRPLVVTTGERDRIFPVEGTRRAFEKLREIYTAADAQEQCELYVGDDGHRFYEKGVWPFVQTHL